MPLSSLSMVTLYDPGWINPRSIEAANVIATWAVNQPGSLSAILPTEDALRLGITDFIGKWLSYAHPTQGTWGGIVNDEPADLGSGTVELSCGSMHLLLDDRVTPVIYQQNTAQAGALMRRGISDAQSVDGLPFTNVLCDETGPAIDTESRGDSLLALAQSLATASGQEFDVRVNDDLSIDFLWRENLGEDVSDRVLIVEGYHVAGGRIDRSRVTVVNDIIGIAADGDFANASATRIESAPSLQRFGRRQQVRRYDGTVAKNAVLAKTRADVRNESDALYLPTLTLPALHPICRDIRHGNTIRYWSHAKNRELKARVISRTVRDGVTLELALEGTEVSIPTVRAPFTPDQLSGLRAWYDFSDASTIATTPSGRFISQVNDKSGNGVHMVPLIPFTANAYTYEPNALVGKAVGRGAANARMVASINLNGITQLTVFIVAKRSAAAEAVFAIESVGRLFFVDAGSGDAIEASYTGNVGTSSFQHTNTWGTSVYHLVTATLNVNNATNEVAVYDNGVTAGTRAANANNTLGFLTASTLSIGYPSIAFDNWAGDVAEIILYAPVLTSTKQAAVENALRTKWGI